MTRPAVFSLRPGGVYPRNHSGRTAKPVWHAGSRVSAFSAVPRPSCIAFAFTLAPPRVCPAVRPEMPYASRRVLIPRIGACVRAPWLARRWRSPVGGALHRNRHDRPCRRSAKRRRSRDPPSPSKRRREPSADDWDWNLIGAKPEPATRPYAAASPGSTPIRCHCRSRRWPR